MKASANKGKKDKKKPKKGAVELDPDLEEGENGEIPSESKAPITVTADDLDDEWGPVKDKKKDKKGKGKKGKAHDDDDEEKEKEGVYSVMTAFRERFNGLMMQMRENRRLQLQNLLTWQRMMIWKRMEALKFFQRRRRRS